MTGNEVKKIRVEVLKETQTVFAKRLGYRGYQSVYLLEKRGKRQINRDAEWKFDTLGLKKFLPVVN